MVQVLNRGERDGRKGIWGIKSWVEQRIELGMAKLGKGHKKGG